MNEAETRADHIDPALAAAGWGVVEGSRIRREYPITLGRLKLGFHWPGAKADGVEEDVVGEIHSLEAPAVAEGWEEEPVCSPSGVSPTGLPPGG